MRLLLLLLVYNTLSLLHQLNLASLDSSGVVMDQLQVFIASAECWVMFSNFCDFVYLMKIEKWCRRRGFYLQYVLMCCCCTQTDEVSDDISPAAAAGPTHHDTPAPLHDVSFVSLTTHHSVPSHVCICLHVSCILVLCWVIWHVGLSFFYC